MWKTCAAARPPRTSCAPRRNSTPPPSAAEAANPAGLLAWTIHEHRSARRGGAPPRGAGGGARSGGAPHPAGAGPRPRRHPPRSPVGHSRTIQASGLSALDRALALKSFRSERALPAQPNPRGRFGRGAMPPPRVLAREGGGVVHPDQALARLVQDELRVQAPVIGVLLPLGRQLARGPQHLAAERLQIADGVPQLFGPPRGGHFTFYVAQARVVPLEPAAAAPIGDERRQAYEREPHSEERQDEQLEEEDPAKGAVGQVAREKGLTLGEIGIRRLVHGHVHA